MCICIYVCVCILSKEEVKSPHVKMRQTMNVIRNQ